MQLANSFFYGFKSIITNLDYIIFGERSETKRSHLRLKKLAITKFLYGLFWAYIFSLTNIIPGDIVLGNITIDNLYQLYFKAEELYIYFMSLYQ